MHVDIGKPAVSSQDVHPTQLSEKVEANGFAVVPSCLNDETVQRLGSEISDTSYGVRNLLAVPVVRELAGSDPVRTLAEALLGKMCFAVKGTFFNKTQESNWKVAWHQDLTIMVQKRREVQGFGPWTVKAGIAHVQPPAGVLSRILAVRLHLDESGEENGPLRVIPGSHGQGRFSAEEVAEWTNRGSTICTTVTTLTIVFGASPAADRICTNWRRAPFPTSDSSLLARFGRIHRSRQCCHP
jgi:hypothetical protein